MPLILRLAEAVVVLALILWTVIFPLATLLSLAWLAPLMLLVRRRRPIALRR